MHKLINSRSLDKFSFLSHFNHYGQLHYGRLIPNIMGD